jgi:membrane-bound hydrogenase subunit beta
MSDVHGVAKGDIQGVAKGDIQSVAKGDIQGVAKGDINQIAAELQGKFALPEGACKVQRATRLWVELDGRSFPALFDHMVKSMGFSILCTITGLDLGAELGFIYHLAHDNGIMVNLKTRVPKGEPIKSVTPYFPGADIYERELEDLFGAHVEGLVPGVRYPLPEDWPQGDHPLLKDWKQPAAAEPRTGAAAASPAGTASPAAATASPAPAAKPAATGAEKGATTSE